PNSASINGNITLDDNDIPISGAFDTTQLSITFPIKLGSQVQHASIVRTTNRIVLRLGGRSGEIFPPPKVSASVGTGALATLSQASTTGFDPLNYGQMHEVTYYEDADLNGISTYHLHAKY